MIRKSTLLFFVILIPFSGCRKTEKKIVETKELHEINIAIPVGVYYSEESIQQNKPSGWETPFFWHINLLNDSFHLKKEYQYTNRADSIYRRSGKFNFKNNRKIERFINLVNASPNGQFFLPDHQYEPNWFTGYIIEYRKGPESKIIFFDGQNTALRVLTELVQSLDTLKKSNQTSFSFKQRQDLMADEVNKIPAFKHLQLRPPLIGAKIKFTPPLEKKTK